MHLAEPRLLWRVKQRDGTWRYVPAKWVLVEQTGPGAIMILVNLPAPPESDESGDESE